MSNTIRQSNIFGETDWRLAYESFLEADYASYDYDTLYSSMVEYIKDNYEDDFNDFIQHSEVLAHVNMLAYLGQAYAFRNDVNMSENFMDDALRRESVIKIASTLTYRVKRNIPAYGELKISSLSTTENIIDSNGRSIQNQLITWNQKGEPTWYDSFIKIIESSFTTGNRFGKPFQRHSGNNRLEIYELNQPKSENYCYPFMNDINGENYRFEIVPSILDNNEVTERIPSTDDPFTIIYRNDGTGNDSPTTGFFVQFKQGSLLKRDFHYNNPKIDRSEILNISNINDTDVWVSEINDNGDLIEYWYDVPSEYGQNVIYNELDLRERNVYFSKTLNDDRVEILYGDGNFSKSPTKHMRVWFRTSLNERYSIRTHDILNVSVNIPYINDDGYHHTLTVSLTNESEINTARISESISSIKKNIQANHYRQERMVTIEDYNIFPYERNPLRKLRVMNRDNAGKSRYPYIDPIDPTGMHSNLITTGADGYVYEEYYELQTTMMLDFTPLDKHSLMQKHIDPLIHTDYFNTFYHNYVFIDMLNEFTESFKYDDMFPRLIWKNTYIDSFNKHGGFKDYTISEINDISRFVRPNTKLLFVYDKQEYWTSIVTVNNDTLVLSEHIPNDAYLYMAIPSINYEISDSIKEQTLTLINKQESFGLRFDIINGYWIIIPQDNIINTDERFDINSPISPMMPDNRWLVRCIFKRSRDGDYYDINVRGNRVIFGSDRQVRFFFTNPDVVDDIKTGLPVKDFVSIINDDNTDGLNTIKPIHDEYVTNTNTSLIYLDDLE